MLVPAVLVARGSSRARVAPIAGTALAAVGLGLALIPRGVLDAG